MNSSFYSEEELQTLGFKSCGKCCLVSKKCSIYNAMTISLGDHVRIDDFCVLSGNITIGNYVHISAFSALYGKGGIQIGNFCGLSPRTVIYSACDDFSGEAMVSPMVPPNLTAVKCGKVVLCDFVQLGANTIVMPETTINEGAVSGAFSLVMHDLSAWTINFGIPCRFHKNRKKNPKELAKLIKPEDKG